MQAVWLNPGVFVSCTNENYTVLSSLEFSSIKIYVTNVSFSGIGFNLTPPASKVVVYFINCSQNPLTSHVNQTIFSIKANSAGSVTYNVSGLKARYPYILKNGSLYQGLVSSATGKVQWVYLAPHGNISFVLYDSVFAVTPSGGGGFASRITTYLLIGVCLGFLVGGLIFNRKKKEKS